MGRARGSEGTGEIPAERGECGQAAAGGALRGKRGPGGARVPRGPAGGAGPALRKSRSAASSRRRCGNSRLGAGLSPLAAAPGLSALPAPPARAAPGRPGRSSRLSHRSRPRPPGQQQEKKHPGIFCWCCVCIGGEGMAPDTGRAAHPSLQAAYLCRCRGGTSSAKTSKRTKSSVIKIRITSQCLYSQDESMRAKPSG